GLYLLSIKGGFQIEGGDTLVILAAFLFAVQILCLDHFAPKMDPILLSFLEYLTQGILAGILLPFFEHPTLDSLAGAMPAILYAGVFSTGIGYTLQVVAQKGLDPTIASMIMSLEGVFSAIFGWLILHEGLAGRELLGCGLMFVAVILASIFGGEKQEKIESGRDSTLRSE
ncbi:MAG: DMT family transporter, partial [Lachnospiraceae bacterium]